MITFEIKGLPKWLGAEGMVKCRVCSELKQRIRGGCDNRSKYVYRDENGKRWQGLRCHSCGIKSKTLEARIKGHKPIDEVTEHCYAKGRESEHTARRFFESLGYSVEMTKRHGPDLIITKDLISTTVEVKSVCKAKKANCFYVQAVSPKRKNDDLIAMVFPSGRIVTEPMKEHLSRCNSSGARVVTKI